MKPPLEPPRLALFLAVRMIHHRIRETMIGDLVEAFPVEAGEVGLARARRRFWRQVLAAIARFPASPRFPSTGDGILRGFVEDLRYGIRTLRRAPAYTMLCAMTLGVGIGAATAIFSVADPIIIRPLPYGEPDRTYVVWENDRSGERNNVGFATYADVRDRATVFASTAALGSWSPVLTRDGRAEQLAGLRVSWSYFRTLGVHPALGNDFTAADDAPARNGVIILSHSLWRTHFTADSNVIGTFADIGGVQMRIAGVMPEGYDDVLAPRAQIWRVLGYDGTLPYACRTCRHLRMIGHLKPGLSREGAAAELNGISAALIRDNPHDYSAPGFQVVTLQHEASRRVRPALTALLAAVALLLLIAAANVSGLQLARALRRDEEFAVRTALGAGIGRLARQLLAEGLLLATVSLGVGLAVAKVGLAQLIGRLPPYVPRLAAVHLDLRAFGLASLVTVAAGIVLGLAPMWHARRSALAGSLRGGRRTVGGVHRLRGALVVSEIAVAVLLLAGAGLLARSLIAVLSVPAGFDIARVATATVQVSGPRYDSSAALFAWQDRLLESVRRIPEVKTAAFVNQLPLGGNVDAYGVQAEDRPLANPELAPSGDRYTVSTDFLRTMDIKILEGRDFESADNAVAGPPVAIVSQSLARRIWGDDSPLGKRIHSGEPYRPWYTVVGVAADVHHRGLDDNETMQIYVPTRRWFFTDNAVDVVVRTNGEPTRVLRSLREAVLAPDPSAVVTRVATMSDVRSQSTAQRSLSLTLFGAFAAIALLLAAAGVFGALAGAVAERMREIGLRVALGAAPRDIVRLVVGSGLGLTGGGVAIGLAGALATARLIRAILFGVGPTDLITLVGVTLVVGFAAILASLVPAWRALRIDPITVLRSE